MLILRLNQWSCLHLLHTVVQVCRLVGQQPCLGSNTWLSLWALHHSVTMSTVSIDVWVGQAEVTWGKPLSRWRHTDRANQTAVTSIDLNTQIKDVRKGSPLCLCACVQVCVLYQRPCGGKWLKVLWFGKLGNQILWIHIHLHADKQEII